MVKPKPTRLYQVECYNRQRSEWLPASDPFRSVGVARATRYNLVRQRPMIEYRVVKVTRETV